jgi:hypothetical protein
MSALFRLDLQAQMKQLQRDAAEAERKLGERQAGGGGRDERGERGSDERV